MTLCFDEPWMSIHLDESIQAVHLEWKRYAEGEEFRAGFNAGLELVRQKRVSRWLGDCRLLGPVTQADQQWINQDWHLRAAAAGLRWIAIVLPRTAVARLSIKYTTMRVNYVDLVFNHFPDVESARAWLRSPSKPA